MTEEFSRTELLIGEEKIQKLQNAKVAIFGIGGVGSYVVEGLARAGIGNFILVDNDEVDITNINRQIIATHKTIGRPKVEVAKERILDINPNANVEIRQEFFMPNSEGILDNTIDYVIDAVDTYKTSICPLAKVIRKELKSKGIEKLKVVYSKEEPIKPSYKAEETNNNESNRKQVPGSISFVPSVAGLIIAGEVIKDIIKEK